MNISVPRDQPKVEGQNAPPVIPKIFNQVAVIGDVPYDEKTGLPFSNAHYGTLSSLLRKAGLSIENCYLANLLRFYPFNGYIGLETKYQVDNGLLEITADILRIKPRVLLLLGRQTLRWFKPGASGLDEERGAPFLWNNIVCLATHHPKEIYVEYDLSPIVEADFHKAVKYLKAPWTETVYNITYAPSFPECVSFLQSIITKKPYLSTDWESIDSILGDYSLATCIGFGINGRRAFVIPFVREGNKHYFSYDEELVIWRLVAVALECCPQLGQNALQYDHWFAAYWQKILMHVVDDTMFAHWEVYTELPKSIAFLNSLYLDNPYWKDELKLARAGKVPRDREFIYNGRDTIVCLQAAHEIGKEIKELPPAVRQHYKFNVRCSRIFQYMSLRGAFVNRDKLKNRIGELEIQAEQMSRRLEEEAHRKISVTSPKQMKEWLYGLEGLALPVRTKAVKMDDGTVEDRETADFLALAYMAREYPGLPALMTAANLRLLKKRLSSLNHLQTGPNGDVYWNFNLIGTETGRASGYKPYNGLGVQPQNVDKRDRDLFNAGPGLVWGKCDLEGADAWTVAGQLLKLGDGTMFDDLRAGLKPAMVLALAYTFDQTLVSASIDTLKPIARDKKSYFKTVDGKLKYDTTKAVSHGTNYMMQAPTMHMTIFKKSKAELYVSVKDCEKLRLLYLKRYPGLQKLYEHIPTIINSHGYIDCPSGMRRQFFGRNDNHRTRVGLALIPQNNTAFATNRCLHNLFYQSYNRREDGVSLVVAPINQVHDEADLAFREDELPLVRDIFARATDFDSEVWGQHFKIPFDPNYGPDWGHCETPIYDEKD